MSYIQKTFFVTVVLGSLLLSLTGAIQAGQAADSGCKIECKTCAATCEQALNYCRKHSGKHISVEHIKALQDCVSTCKQSADFMQRRSALQNSACALCEKACLSCADSCAAFTGDKTMQACAQECKKCAQFCNKMAN